MLPVVAVLSLGSSWESVVLSIVSVHGMVCLHLPLHSAGIFIPSPSLAACVCKQESFHLSMLCCGMSQGSGNGCGLAGSSRVSRTRILTANLEILLWCRGFLQAPRKQMALSVRSHSPLQFTREEIQLNFQLSLLSNFTAVYPKLKHPPLIVLCIFMVTGNLFFHNAALSLPPLLTLTKFAKMTVSDLGTK